MKKMWGEIQRHRVDVFDIFCLKRLNTSIDMDISDGETS